ncbi:MAG: hypothetical protein FWD70_03925 [Desulfuromonadales bacterium]|nr:hypothetical protein [Desulfuromonadales bacterium]
MKKVGIILLSVGIAALVGVIVLVFIMTNAPDTSINNSGFENGMTLGFIVLPSISLGGIIAGIVLLICSRVKRHLNGALGSQFGMLNHMSQMMKTPQAIGTAKVITVTDTGKVLGANPIVSIQLEIAIPNRPNSTYQMETQVQSSAIPQVGDTISIGIMPGQYTNQFNGQQTDWVYMGIVK